MKVLQPGIYVRGKKKKKKKGKNVPRPSGYADGCQARREIGTGWKGGMEGLALEDSKELYTRKWQIEVRPTSDTSPFSRRFPQQFFLPASPPPPFPPKFSSGNARKGFVLSVFKMVGAREIQLNANFVRCYQKLLIFFLLLNFDPGVPCGGAPPRHHHHPPHRLLHRLRLPGLQDRQVDNTGTI